MNKLVSGALLLAALPLLAAQAPAEKKALERVLDADFEYIVKAKWKGGGFAGKPEKLRIELRVKNAGKETVRLEFSNSGRVCGVIHDTDDKPVYRFPEVTAQVVGSEEFLPGKERLFVIEIPSKELRKLTPGTAAVAVWLCGYGELRHWAEFYAPYSLQEAEE